MDQASKKARILGLSIALVVGGCTAGADRSVFDMLSNSAPEPPSAPERARTTGDLSSQTRPDGYIDPSFVPNPERAPELSEAEREAMEQELREIGEAKMENRVMNCGSDDPAECVQ